MKIIYLVGIKHAGKSKLGQFASVALNTSYRVAFADTDDLMMKNLHGKAIASVRDYYRDQGKASFMKLEYEVVQQYIHHLEHHQYDIVLIATGGGICDNEPLVSFMHDTGTLLYLSVEEAELFKRIMKNGIPPFIDQGDPESSFHDLYVRRNEQYRHISDYMVRLSDYQSVAENGQLLTQAILILLGRGTSCQEILLERL